MPEYYIKEIKATIEAKDEADFQAKKARLLSRHENRYLTGGRKATSPKIRNYSY